MTTKSSHGNINPRLDAKRLDRRLVLTSEMSPASENEYGSGDDQSNDEGDAGGASSPQSAAGNVGDIENFILDEDAEPELVSENGSGDSSHHPNIRHRAEMFSPILSDHKSSFDDSRRSTVSKKSLPDHLFGSTSNHEKEYDDGMLSNAEFSSYRAPSQPLSPEHSPPQTQHTIIASEEDEPAVNELDSTRHHGRHRSKGLLEGLINKSDRTGSSSSNGSAPSCRYAPSRSANVISGDKLRHARTETATTVNSESTPSNSPGINALSSQTEGTAYLTASAGSFVFVPQANVRSNVARNPSMSSIGENAPVLASLSVNSPPGQMDESLEVEREATNRSCEEINPATYTTGRGSEGVPFATTGEIVAASAVWNNSLRSSVSNGDLSQSNSFNLSSQQGRGPKMYSAVFGSMEHGSFLPQYQASFQKKLSQRALAPGQQPTAQQGREDAFNLALSVHQPVTALYFPVSGAQGAHIPIDCTVTYSMSAVRNCSEKLASSPGAQLLVSSRKIDEAASGGIHSDGVKGALDCSNANSTRSGLSRHAQSERPSLPSALRTSSAPASERRTPNNARVTREPTVIASIDHEPVASPKSTAAEELFRPSSDAYTPRLKKAPRYKQPSTRQTAGSTNMGTLSRPNFRDALRRVSMIIQQHVTKIERRFDGPKPLVDSGLFLPSMRDVFHEDNFITPRYKCTLVRLLTATAGVICVKQKIPVVYEVPTEEEIYDFGHQLFKTVQLSSECSIVCLIYIERLMEAAKVPLLGTTWRPIFMAGLLLASKVWQDLSSWNIELANVYPQYNLEAINKLELLFLRNVKWDLYISSSLYAKYYFALRSILEKQDFRNRYNRMVCAAGQVDVSQAMKVQKRTEMVKEEALMELSKSM
jgi:hypothetical protein